MHAANYAMTKTSKENLLRRMQDLLANMTPDDQDSFMAKLNISTQATVEPLAKGPTTVPNIGQPKPPEHTSPPSDGLFAEAYQAASLL